MYLDKECGLQDGEMVKSKSIFFTAVPPRPVLFEDIHLKCFLQLQNLQICSASLISEILLHA